MSKKLILFWMAVAAFAAFMTAPAARAAVLTENGVALAVGSSVTDSNTGVIKFTGGFGVECEVGHLQSTVTSNSGGTIELTYQTGGSKFTNAGGAACKSLLGATTVTLTHFCLHIAKGTDGLTITGCIGNFKFVFKTGGTECKYETASISGTYTTNTTPAKATVSEQEAKEVGGSFFCPDTGKLDMTFDFYTTGGTTGLTLS